MILSAEIQTAMATPQYLRLKIGREYFFENSATGSLSNTIIKYGGYGGNWTAVYNRGAGCLSQILLLVTIMFRVYFKIMALPQFQKQNSLTNRMVFSPAAGH